MGNKILSDILISVTYTKDFVNCFLLTKCFLFRLLKLPLSNTKKDKIKNTY